MINVDAGKLYIAILTSRTHNRHYLMTGWQWHCLEFRVSHNTYTYVLYIHTMDPTLPTPHLILHSLQKCLKNRKKQTQKQNHIQKKEEKKKTNFFPQFDIFSVVKFPILWVIHADHVHCLPTKSELITNQKCFLQQFSNSKVTPPSFLPLSPKD